MRAANGVKIIAEIDNLMALRIEHHALRMMSVRGDAQPLGEQPGGFRRQRAAGV